MFTRELVQHYMNFGLRGELYYMQKDDVTIGDQISISLDEQIMIENDNGQGLFLVTKSTTS